MCGMSESEHEEEIDLPSLTLIFSSRDPKNADWDRLLELSDVAIDAIENADSRFQIIKAFTFYAGMDYDPDKKNEKV